MNNVDRKKGKILLIGFGPGHYDHLTFRARQAIEESDSIIGYNTYVDLIRGLLTDQEIVRTGMTEEVSRAQEAVRQAEAGRTVAVISSGDAGVYGMAGLIYEVLVEKGWRAETGIDVEVIPGISAIQSCASLLGAPVMHDACTISLSDHLTPWATIAKRVEAAASADFVIALYNPRSGRRTRQIVETQRILLQHRSPDTPVGLVKSAYRDRQHVVLTRLADMLEHDIGMLTTVIIGNSTTFVYDGKMITPRGYQRKYTLVRDEQPLKPHQRLQAEAEPWALDSMMGMADDDSDEEEWDEPIRPNPQQTIGSRGIGEPLMQSRTALSVLERDAEQVTNKSDVLSLALEALACLDPQVAVHHANTSLQMAPSTGLVEIFEVGVSPGVADKRFTSQQMRLLADLTEDGGEMYYTPDHQIHLKLPNVAPDEVVAMLEEAGFLLFPIGQVAQVKACDFCNLEKDESIPYAEMLGRSLDGVAMPKELKIGFNGCGMACYGAVMEDIGLIYRRGAFDLFLGGKKISRSAHPGQRVEEGIAPERIVEVVEQIVAEYKARAHVDERFHKFFKRVGVVAGYKHEEYVAPLVIESACGD
ncbi:UNVERIFIED_CONTAM: precorrin-3B C17-methyltransferase [Brevibacillus sp. OAP136]